MSTSDASEPTVTLGWVILYVHDVDASLRFYEQAFGLKRRFFNDEYGRAYGELESGAARIAFASLSLAQDQLNQEVTLSDPQRPPLSIELALATPDVGALFARAVAAGAKSVSEPRTKPWGQTVAYVRDHAGHLVEICTPMP
jgi:uncharacterized glyoxalase superfamily protein PhnB